MSWPSIIQIACSVREAVGRRNCLSRAKQKEAKESKKERFIFSCAFGFLMLRMKAIGCVIPDTEVVGEEDERGRHAQNEVGLERHVNSAFLGVETQER